ncbi:ABC transporter ATP-binding protein [Alkalicoccus daliensis]|uniref:ABC-2 type transport system ATP-binding protein n=1 Tax=Alkalicoccus daliensis TaxID=745820 RepID=A0A1H0DM12_9BACI|nr:ABC transporter ATP-binding protein [Alkalicoccus daliensis]SDN71210.1 ABC-2 type transport system ATP-binding protein [Alkalicoccus daliensis]
MTLELENLHKKFGEHTAVKGINLSVKEGQMFGMLGSNGAGKTTTFRMILGLLDPTSGSAAWNGARIDYSRTHLIGYLPEERGLYPKLTVKDQLIYLMKLNKMKKPDIIVELRKWLERFQIESYENKKVEELSKGNQQKIQFMAAVLHKPELLILDEPFSGLDPVNSDMLKKAVLDLQKQGTTIVFSSHQMRNVEELCDDLIMLKHGEALLQGNLKDIKRSYGMKSVKIKADFDLQFLENIPGVLDLHNSKVETDIKVESEEIAEVIFREAAEKGFLRKFEVEEPSLHDIFIDQAGGESNE